MAIGMVNYIKPLANTMRSRHILDFMVFYCVCETLEQMPFTSLLKAVEYYNAAI